MKKSAAWVTIISLFAVLLAACGGKNNDAASPASLSSSPSASESAASPSNPGEVVTIRTSLGATEFQEGEIAEFEKEHPNIKIEFEELDATKLNAQLATGEAPDVIRMGGVYELPQWVNKGVAMDLTGFFDKSTVIKQDDLLPIANVYRYDGKTVGQGPIYGLPKDWGNDFAIFYNKKVFEAAGVPLPDTSKPMTWPEVLDLAKKLVKKDGGKITQYGLAATDWAKSEPHYSLLMQYLLSAGQTINAADSSSVNFDKPAVKDFINMWVDAVKANIGPNSLNNDQTNGNDLFFLNKIGMVVDGYWYSGRIRTDHKERVNDFGMMPTPIAPGGEYANATGGATGAIINKATKHPQEAWTFYEWVFGGKPADTRAKTGWGLPVFKSKLDLLPRETDFDKQVYDVLQQELEHTKFLDVNPYLSGGGWAIFEKYVTPLYFGKSSVDEAVKGMTKDANVAIKEAMNAK